MRYTIQFYHTDEESLIPAICVQTDKKRYIFNIPEAFQRYYNEHRIRFWQGTNFFLTSISYDHFAGLLCLLLTAYVKEVGLESKIFGPPGLFNFIQSARYLVGYRFFLYAFTEFITKKSIPGFISKELVENFIKSPEYKTHFFKIDQILAKLDKKQKNDAIPFMKDPFTFQDENLKISAVVIDPQTKPDAKNITLCYICETPQFPGKAIKEKLDALNIPKKEIGILLKEGKLTVNGKEITAAEVTEPSIDGSIFVIVDCPTLDHLSVICKTAQLQQVTKPRAGWQFDCVIHITPKEVVMNGAYLEFFSNYGDKVNHIFTDHHLRDPASSNVALSALNYYKSTKRIIDFNRIAPDYFPIIKPSHIALSTPEGTPETIVKLPVADKTQLSLSRKFAEFLILPRKPVGYLPVKIDPEESKYAAVSIPPRGNMNVEDALPSPQVVFLGTGSMMPGIHRNVSGILLRSFQAEKRELNTFLDCGEGTYLQLVHHFGRVKAEDILLHTRVIFLSHIHCDHNMGIFELLQQRHEAAIRRGLNQSDDRTILYVVTPSIFVPFLKIFDENIAKYPYKLVLANDFAPPGTMVEEKMVTMSKAPADEEMDIDIDIFADKSWQEYLEEVKAISAGNVKQLRDLLNENHIGHFATIPVLHCHDAFGIAIGGTHLGSPWKIVYSGDTRPCEALIQAGKDATLLIHEATFENELAKSAEDRMHSTIGEALEVAIKMNAQALCATHLSQRYDNVPIGFRDKPAISEEQLSKLLSGEGRKAPKLISALDHLHFNLADIDHLASIQDALAKFVPPSEKTEKE